MKRKHQRTLELIFSRPVFANARWTNIEALPRELGAEFEEREGSRFEVFLFGLDVFFIGPTLYRIRTRARLQQFANCLNGCADFYAADVQGLKHEGEISLRVFL